MPLIAVIGDKNTHGDGDLICDNNPGKVFIGGKLVSFLGCQAAGDKQDHPTGTTNPSTASGKVFGCGIAIHRQGDMRQCGATTVVSNQSKVTAG